MSPALRDYARLWSAATASRDVRAMWTFRIVALVFPFIVGLLVWMKTGVLADALAYALRVPVAILIFAALTYYVPGAIRMNTPANARLVPRMRRRLVELTLLVWAVASASAALLAWGTPVPAATVAMMTFAWVVGLGLASAGYQVGTVMQVALLLSIALRRHLPDFLFQQPLAGALGLLLLLALGARTLELMFPNGGERHWNRRDAQARAVERARPEGMMREASTWRFAGSLYAAALRRNSSARRAPAFLLPLLGPAMHWTQRYLPLLALVALVAALVTLVKLYAGAASFETGFVIGLCEVMLFVQLFVYEQRALRLADTPAEQGVLRMTPSFAAAALPFNRRLNGALLRMALLDWAAIVVALVTVAAIAGAPAHVLLLQVQLCCVTLPLVASNVRDHARHKGSGMLRMSGGVAGTVAWCAGVAALAHKLADAPVMPTAALAGIVLAVVVVAWRWRSAVGAPHAFPVGRLA